MVVEDIVRQLRVVNDIAERGDALMQEFNVLLTEDEEQTQFAIFFFLLLRRLCRR